MQRADRSPGRFSMTDTISSEHDEARAPALLLDPSENRYQHQGTLAMGGMGRVEHAYDVILRRQVALKMPRTDAKNPAARCHDLWREAQLTAQLEHPGVPAIYELLRDAAGTPSGFAMQMVRGQTLLERIDGLSEARLSFAPLRGLVDVLIDACDVVAFAHQHSILHLDLKAENLMIERSGRVYVLDWGVAARCGARADGRLMPLDISRGASGTLSYMAPEQFASSLDGVDERTDVYALGGVLYHILWGRAPFHARDPHALPGLDGALVLGELPGMSDLGAGLLRIAGGALSPEKAERYTSVLSFKQALLHLRASAKDEPDKRPMGYGSERSSALSEGRASGRQQEKSRMGSQDDREDDAEASAERSAERVSPRAPETQPQQKALAILGSVWLFADLGQRELERLSQVCVRKRFASEAVVVRQGETDGDLYVVIDGLLRVSVRANEQRELALNLLRSGDVCGELSLVDGRARSATITAVQASELLVIRRAEFMDVLDRSPALAVRLLQTMAGHVRRLTERVEDLSVLPISTRLAKKLLEIADLCGTALDANRIALPLTLSQQDLADHVQATRESVNKCLARWTRDSIVYRTQSQIVINDRARLRALLNEPLAASEEPALLPARN